ncbi:mitogen-activated protein kinase kinase kinase 7 [Stomoxys calcitrans]|uniref:mitogen-activated protein kinase kinase kinase 7 n=1 Tax=Stomoxys calcitrans TaxID=35570 RepID=UPI0027E3ADF2|nr:mitogen-activated protein kinase kinase kinase 7 [Stomoxys calcitrans]
MTDETPEQAAGVTTPTTSNGTPIASEEEGAVSFPLPPPAAANQTPHLGILSSGGFSLLCPGVDFTEISFKEKVGHGSYGVVYKAFWRDRFVAVKEFGPKAEQKAIETEVKQLSRVQHQNIISLYGIALNQMSTYLIMEYAEGGSLYDFLHGKVKPYYSKAHAMSWARQCAEGVAYLHAMKPKPLIHRDLKPLNLLLTNKGRHLKICDFGTVADKSTLMTNNKGSAAWMAPEVFEGSKYTEKCDIFSWGIVLWEVLSRQKPFKDVDNTYSIMWKIHKGERPPIVTEWPEPIQNLMTSCWATKPDLRPSMQLVVEDMHKLVQAYPGADEPLEYEFKNQQIVSPNVNGTNGDSYVLDFSDYSNSSSYGTSNTQVTRPTTEDSGDSSNSNRSSSATPTNPFLPHAHIDSIRWDVIPEESECSTNHSDDPADNAVAEPFNLSTSEESKKRYETIRSNMLENAHVPMAPLGIDVDPKAFDLFRAKSDGKERIMVTEAKPIIKSVDQINPNYPVDANDTDLDEDEENGQPLEELLDPELQPEQPIPDNAESQEIFKEHRRLAMEYLKVNTSLYYAQDIKERILIQMAPQERQEKQELLKRMKEKQELMELYNNLKQHWDAVRSSVPPEDQPSRSEAPANANGNNELIPDDSWVVINRNQNS